MYARGSIYNRCMHKRGLALLATRASNVKLLYATAPHILGWLESKGWWYLVLGLVARVICPHARKQFLKVLSMCPVLTPEHRYLLTRLKVRPQQPVQHSY